MRNLLLLGALLPLCAGATTLNFTFTGFQPTEVIYGNGTGSLSFPTGLTSVGLNDLTSFNFTDVIDFVGNGAPPPGSFTTIQYGLADLSSLSVTLGPDGLPTAVDLGTSKSPDFPGENTAFRIEDQGPGNGWVGIAEIAVGGSVTFTTAPEPASASLWIISGLVAASLAGIRLRRGASAR